MIYSQKFTGFFYHVHHQDNDQFACTHNATNEQIILLAFRCPLGYTSFQVHNGRATVVHNRLYQQVPVLTHCCSGRSFRRAAYQRRGAIMVLA